jgi:hypothetical protein
VAALAAAELGVGLWNEEVKMGWECPECQYQNNDSLIRCVCGYEIDVSNHKKDALPIATNRKEKGVDGNNKYSGQTKSGKIKRIIIPVLVLIFGWLLLFICSELGAMILHARNNPSEIGYFLLMPGIPFVVFPVALRLLTWKEFFKPSKIFFIILIIFGILLMLSGLMTKPKNFSQMNRAEYISGALYIGAALSLLVYTFNGVMRSLKKRKTV